MEKKITNEEAMEMFKDLERIQFKRMLMNPKNSIDDRIDGMTYMYNDKSKFAVKCMIKAFLREPEDGSDFMRHEICYCLGIMGDTPENVALIQPFLEKILTERTHSEFVMHEVIQALQNINVENTFRFLEQFQDKKRTLEYETSYLTKRLLDWKAATECGKSEGLDVEKLNEDKDPAPLFNYKLKPEYADIVFLKKILLDNEHYDLFERYRALYTLKDLDTEEAALALCMVLMRENWETCSELMRHDVAFVFRHMDNSCRVAVP